MSLHAQEVQVAEALDRGCIAITTSTGNLVQWRKFTDDDAESISYALTITSASNTTKTINIPAGRPSYYLDKTKGIKYTLMVKDAEGNTIEEQTMTDIVPAKSQLTQIKLNRPDAGKTPPYTVTNNKVEESYPNGQDYTYSPNDCTVADVDGDGAYEIIVKWDPSNSRDNSHGGYTGNVIFDCYEISGPDAGKQLWRIDLGVNVRAGAHYNPFLAYDFDGDGKAEFVVKTAPGSKDSKGNYVSSAATLSAIKNTTSNGTTYRNSSGHILKGEEYLTIFNGETGEAMQTVYYWPNLARGAAASSSSTAYSWSGDSYGNRGHRYNAAVAYLDGLDKLPSIIMQRGYYTEAYFWAVDWNGKSLTTRWLHRGTSKTAWSVLDGTGKTLYSGSGKSSYGQGVHGISVGDVDDDGFDEIVMGSATIDHNGKLLCSTGFGHGDAIHLTKHCPDRPGLQIYMPHEESSCNYGDDMHDAATGEILWRGTTSSDNGRGLACDMYYTIDNTTGLDKYLGSEFWSGAESNPTNAVNFSTVGSKPDTNFRIYWNGDLYDESLDGRYSSSTGGCDPRIITYNGGNKSTTLASIGGQPRSCNGTKATPCLTADIWGDWREEAIFWDASDYATLDIYTTADTTHYPVPCLMQDHVYRMGVAWQNSSYNQPPHLGYYLPDAYLSRYTMAEGSGEATQTVEAGQEITPIVLNVKNVKSLSRSGTAFSLGLKYELDAEAGTATVSGKINREGAYTSNVLTLVGEYNNCKLPVKITVTPATNIEQVAQESVIDKNTVIYDIIGRQVDKVQKGGIYIINGHKTIIK